MAVALAIGVEPAFGLIPGAIAGGVQHVSGHVSAWRRGGVERAFIMESSAISFYVVVILLSSAAVLQTSGVLDVDIHWLAIGAFYIDTIVRSVREHRYV